MLMRKSQESSKNMCPCSKSILIKRDFIKRYQNVRKGQPKKANCMIEIHKTECYTVKVENVLVVLSKWYFFISFYVFYFK